VKWKECLCDIWEERNLSLRAEEVVDREAIHHMRASAGKCDKSFEINMSVITERTG
jgi:hypothetical protein